MICMDAGGKCATAKPHADAPRCVEHPVLGAPLTMYARRISCADDLDAPSLLRIALPMPFGKHIVFAPVMWAYGSGPLSCAKLTSMLETLSKAQRARGMSRALVLPAAMRHTAVDSEDDVIDASDADGDDIDAEPSGDDDEGEGDDNDDGGEPDDDDDAEDDLDEGAGDTEGGGNDV